MKNNQELIAGLRAFLEFLEANADFDFEQGSKEDLVQINFRAWYLRGTDSEKQTIMGDLVKRLGSGKKSYSDEWFWFRHDFSPNVRLDITSDRKTVCERIVTGTKIIPATEERIIPAEPEREVEAVEWRCAPLLAGAE